MLQTSIVFAVASLGLTRGVKTMRQLRMAAPVAKKLVQGVPFGINPSKPDEVRGTPGKVMNPPITIDDPYYWMRDDDRKNKDVIGYLNAENTYAEDSMAHLNATREQLYKEMLSHMKETDEDVPYPNGPYLYYGRSEEGKSYRIHCRKLKEGVQKEEIVLDENVVAEGKAYASVGALAMSPDHKFLAYAVDYTGYETYTVSIKNMVTGEDLEEVIEETSGDITWGADSSTLFYTLMDDEHRPNELRMRVLGASGKAGGKPSDEDDISILQEDDALFWMGIGKTASKRFLCCQLESKETSEVHVIDLDGVGGAEGHVRASKNIKLMSKREKMVRYDVEHWNDDLLLITNKDGAKTNKLMSVPIASAKWGSSHWVDVRPYDQAIQVDAVEPFENYLTVFGREGGIMQMWVSELTASKGGKANMAQWTKVAFPEKVYSVHCGQNRVFSSDKVRIAYTSLTSPMRTIDYDMSSGTFHILKEKEVPLYNQSEYACQRMECLSRDGKTMIPMSIVYRKDLAVENNVEKGILKFAEAQPMLLGGYGSYGACSDPYFDHKRLTLLKRGVVCCTAHIRGGGEMGHWWYEDEGKYLQKQNTFSDFADCAKYLVKSGLTSSDKLGIVGRSAGGLLMGAVVNQNPGLFKACIASVPFVDVMTTMSDPTIPLTVGEWEEWGNPNEKEFHDYMMKYSPIDNVIAQEYCSMFVTAGLNDPRVAYWEPAKWVAKLRDLKTDNNPLLFKCDMDTGHFSASDRYKYMKEMALEQAYLLWQIAPHALIQ